MYQVSFSKAFEIEAMKLGLSDNLPALQADLNIHLTSIHLGDGLMPIPYLGRTEPFDYPQHVQDAGLYHVHVKDDLSKSYSARKWKNADRLYDRTSDTFFVFAKNYLAETEVKFLGVFHPGHIKCSYKSSGNTYFGPLVDAANEFNGIK